LLLCLKGEHLFLNNFEAFLVAFAEVFEDHDKACSTTTKIRVLRQESHPVSIYALDFRLLAFDINWDEEALMSQFHWGLRDNVKDLLLSMLNPQILNEAISRAVRCDNRLFQRRQDQRSWNAPKYSYSYSAASTIISNSHSRTEDMQIDAVLYKPLTAQEKKYRFDGSLCLYYRESGQKADNCPKKQHHHTFKMRNATTSSNSQTENGAAEL
jgi:hypothetical protein